MTETRGHLSAAKICPVYQSNKFMDDDIRSVTCMFNPNEYSITKSNTFHENQPGSKSKYEVQESSTQTLSLKLIFDAYESGNDVLDETGKLMSLMHSDKNQNYDITKLPPPEVAFHWGKFVFYAYITRVTQHFSLFQPNGTPVRAEVTVEFTHFENEAENQNPTSGGGPIYRVHRLVAGDRLDTLSADTYGDATKWRLIAQANNITNPLALRPGQILRLPSE